MMDRTRGKKKEKERKGGKKEEKRDP